MVLAIIIYLGEEELAKQAERAFEKKPSNRPLKTWDIEQGVARMAFWVEKITIFQLFQTVIQLTSTQKPLTSTCPDVDDDDFSVVRNDFWGKRDGSWDAAAVFKLLREFWKRRRGTSTESTIPEVERNVRALLHGRKEDSVPIENEGDKVIKGKRTIIDNTHKKPRCGFKEMLSGRSTDEMECGEVEEWSAAEADVRRWFFMVGRSRLVGSCIP